MRLGDMEEWSQDIQKILDKNRERRLYIAVSITLLLGFIVISIGLNQSILVILAIILAFIIVVFFPKPIRLEMSELLAYYFYQLFLNIDKFDGKNLHYKEEARKWINEINEIVKIYLQSKDEEAVYDFNGKQNREYVLKLQANLPKLNALFENFERNKEYYELLRVTVRDLSHSFRDEKNFSEVSRNLILNLEKLPIQTKGPVYEGILKSATAIVSTKTIIFLVVFIIYPFIVVYAPDFFSISVSAENKFIAVVTVMGGMLLQYFLPSIQQQKK